MTHQLVYDYVKLIIENLWILLALAGALWLVTRPGLLERITRVKMFELEIELKEVKAELENTKLAVKEMSALTEEYQSALDNLEMSGDVAALRASQGAIKALATQLDSQDLAPVRTGLLKGASADALHGAAVIARTRRDPKLFDDVIQSLAEIAASPDLGGRRLNTVWQLASAVHLTLVSVFKHGQVSAITQDQLKRARAVLEKLQQHERVLADRPDNPGKGIRGPVTNALKWIESATTDQPGK